MFKVEWHPRTLDELTAIWIQADSPLRKTVTSAMHQFELRLQSDPLGCGESREGGMRVFLLTPLGIHYRLEDDEATITVLRLWAFRT